MKHSYTPLDAASDALKLRVTALLLP